MIHRLVPSLCWLDLLPLDIARKIAIDNARRIFKIDG
jgi:hypothetical protein